jgi:hypothetical protein
MVRPLTRRRCGDLERIDQILLRVLAKIVCRVDETGQYHPEWRQSYERCAAAMLAAVLAAPERKRAQHFDALSGLLHLLGHCCGCEPRGFVAGHRAYRLPALRWAAELLERPWIECTAPDCTDPGHVTLLNEPISGEARR